jgi:hypothetical protein
VALFQQLKASGAEARETATALQQSRKANE